MKRVGLILSIGLLAACGGPGKKGPLPETTFLIEQVKHFGGGHSAEVVALAMTPDGRWVVSGGKDRLVRIWDRELGIEKKVLARFEQPVRGLAVSPDGTRVAVADSATVRVFDVETQQALKTLAGHRFEVNAVAFSPDGKSLATGGNDNRVLIWNLEDGSKTAEMVLQDYAVSAQFSPDGARLLVVQGDHTIRVWDVGEKRDIRTIKHNNVLFWHAAYSPDGKYIAAGGEDRVAYVWESVTGTGSPVASLVGHSKRVSAVAWSGDSAYLVTGSHDATLRVWKVADWSHQKTLTGHAAEVTAVAAAPDGAWALSASKDVSVRQWNVIEGQEIVPLTAHGRPPRTLALNPAGTLLASGGDDRAVRWWKLPEGVALAASAGHFGAVMGADFTDDGKILATGAMDGAVILWDVETRKMTHRFLAHHGGVMCLDVSPNGKYIACGSADGSIQIWDIPNKVDAGNIKAAHGGPVRAVAFNPNGDLVAATGDDGALSVWTAATWTRVGAGRGHAAPTEGLDWTAGGYDLVTASRDRTMRFWTRSGSQARPQATNLHPFTSVAVSPDGKYLFTGALDHTVQLWEFKTGLIFKSFAAHDRAVRKVRVSADGAWLVTAGDDVTIKLWRVTPPMSPKPPEPPR